MIGPHWRAALGVALVSLSLSCTTPEPPPAPPRPVSLPQVPPHTVQAEATQEAEPQVAWAFERLEVHSPDEVSLYFTVQVDNPRSKPASLAIGAWQWRLNGLPQEAGATLILGEEPPQVGADASARIPLELAIDWSQCAEGDARAEAYQTEIQAELMFAFAETEQTTVGFCAEAVSPRIRAPTFTVTAIVVNQGELINTRLKVALKIDNPNAFPLQLSGLAYAFYGDQRFWADGNDRAVRHIPPQSSTEAQISMVMNFIDMNRKLLEDILTAKQIDYRLTGEAAVLTTNEYLPRFSVDFDLSGNSVVMK